MISSTSNEKRNISRIFHQLVNIFLSVCLLVSVIMTVYGLRMLGKTQDAYWDLNRWGYIVIALSVFLQIIISVMFFVKREWKINFSILLFSIGITIFFVNIYLVIKAGQLDIINAYERGARRAKVKFDNRTKLEVVRDLREKNINAYPSYSPGYQANVDNDFKKLLPLGGVSNSATVYCNETGEYLVFNSDRYGFNNDDTAYDKDIDFLIIGDSYAQGACVQPGEDIAGVLRKKGYNAISLGAGGGCPLGVLACLLEYGVHLKPRYVICTIYDKWNLGRLKLASNIDMLMRYLNLDFSQNLINRQYEIDNFLKRYINKVYDEKLKKELEQNKAERKYETKGFVWKIITLYRVRLLVGFHRGHFLTKDRQIIEERTKQRGQASAKYTDNKNFMLLKETLEKSKRVTGSFGGKFYYVFLPTFEAPLENQLLRRSNRLDSILKELNIPIIDFSKEAMKLDNPHSILPFGIATHYTAQGYELLADQIIHETKE